MRLGGLQRDCRPVKVRNNTCEDVEWNDINIALESESSNADNVEARSPSEKVAGLNNHAMY